MRDLVVAGGGPVGLATALLAARAGLDVEVREPRRGVIDKACGEGLMPDSLLQLERLGVSLSPSDGAAFHGIRFAGEDATATAHFSAGAGIGLRRQALHTQLVARAQDAGVALRWQTPVFLRVDGRAQIAGETQRYGWLVGADGQGSQVRRRARLERGRLISWRFGFRQHYQVEPWSPYIEVHWGERGQAYVTPTGPNEVCVATVTRDPQCRLPVLLDELPDLRAKLSRPQVTVTDHERGALTTTRRFNCVARGRVALVGDASGSADAITGEGMGLAFRQALLLAECLERGDLARYNRKHSETLCLPQAMARVLLSMDRWKAVRRRALGMLAREPELFTHMLGVHLGAESLLHFVSTKGLKVAWGLTIGSSDEPSLPGGQAIQEN